MLIASNIYGKSTFIYIYIKVIKINVKYLDFTSFYAQTQRNTGNGPFKCWVISKMVLW